MANITTCPRCGSCYEESSEEQANAPTRCCASCRPIYILDKDYRFIGTARTGRGVEYACYHDMLNKTSFSVFPGETVDEKLSESRARYAALEAAQ